MTQSTHWIIMKDRKNIAFSDIKSKKPRIISALDHFPSQYLGSVFHHCTTGSTLMLQSHRHAEWEINLVTRGSAAYLIDGRRVALQLDSMLWLLPSQGHVLMDRSDDFEMWLAVIRPQVIEQLAGDALFADWRVWLDDTEPRPPLHRLVGEEVTRELSHLFERLALLSSDEPHEPAMSPAHHGAGLTFLLAEAWSAYARAPDRPAGSHLHPAVQRAVNWLADHAHEPQADDLDALAEQCHVSRPHLSRLFKQQTGHTLTDFRNQQRADRFTALLGRGGRMNLTQAAYAAGFGSYAQAFRIIKQLTGQSPRGLLQPH